MLLILRFQFASWNWIIVGFLAKTSYFGHLVSDQVVKLYIIHPRHNMLVIKHTNYFMVANAPNILVNNVIVCKYH